MSDDLAFAGLAGAAEKVRAKEISSRELTELYLRRIERIDPDLNAYRLSYGDRALAEADQADARVASGDERRLLGVPVAVKDNMDVAGDITTHGTSAAEGAARVDSEIVRRLRTAGAVILGHTNVPELCMWGFTETATFGRTRNPWNPAHTSGGSSGGSAAAVAAGLCAAATGSDGLGSIRGPSALNGLFGIKPTRGRVPMDAAEHWYGLSVFGGITRTVRDAALFLDVTGDFAERLSPLVDADAPKLRIAVSTKPPPTVQAALDPEVEQGLQATADLLRSLGHDVVARDPDYGLSAFHTTTRYLKGVGDDAAALAHPERLERRTRAVARIGSTLPDALLARARRNEAEATRRITALWNDVDVLLTPTTPRAAGRVGAFEGRGALYTMNGQIAAVAAYVPPFNLTGQPAASLPAGFTRAGLPIGVQMVARPGEESTLVALGAQIERERPWADKRPALAD